MIGDHHLAEQRGKNALVVEGLRKAFGGVQALQGISFDVGPAEVLGVIGPNGSGKTTLLNVLSGIYSADSGRVRFADRDITGLRPWQVCAVGIARTFQNIRLFPELSVADNILIGFHRRLQRTAWSIVVSRRPPSSEEAWAREAAIRVLDTTDSRLVATVDRPAHTLPYADQRRVEIARALATDPSLLLLDEPTAGMNPVECREIIELVLRLSRNGIGVIIVEHNMRVIKELMGRVIVMDYGEKIAEGPYSEVRNDRRVIECYLGSA